MHKPVGLHQTIAHMWQLWITFGATMQYPNLYSYLGSGIIHGV